MFLPNSPLFLILLPYILIHFSPSCDLPPDFYQCLHLLCCPHSHAVLLSSPCLSYFFFPLVFFYPLWRRLYVIEKTKLPDPSSGSAHKASSWALNSLSQKAAGPAVCPSSGTCAPRIGLRGELSSHPPGLNVCFLLCTRSKFCCFHFGLVVIYTLELFPPNTTCLFKLMFEVCCHLPRMPVSSHASLISVVFFSSNASVFVIPPVLTKVNHHTLPVKWKNKSYYSSTVCCAYDLHWKIFY